MVVYVCSCLNVKIFADAIKVQDVNKSSPLGSDVVEIELGDRGFDFKYGFLLKRETVKSWTLFTCLNCRKKTHCINRELKLILVSKDMECGDEALARLGASPNFSHVFQIILTDQDCFAAPDSSSQSYDSLQQQLQDITHHLNNFVLKQENFVEERIRRFEEEQREHLAKVKAKALEDKKKMFSLLLQQRSDPHEQQSGAARAQRPRMLTKTNSVFTESSRQHVSQPVAMPRSRQTENVVPDIDRDELFTIDGLDDDYASYHSSSEDEDEVPAVKSRPSQAGSRSDSLYSASVPVNIGMGAHWSEAARRSDHLDSSDSDEEPNKPLDMNTICNNIMVIAESIPDENRYIFGERPRPRLSTNNF
ncbi:uncharacterized protein LOC143286558 [Babylonia areolata]|uniref:uncharacterized protein LOC143286558 n=1 Tax=Babylonia areolata TaxID=304850 RepID=UPI003FD4EE0B